VLKQQGAIIHTKTNIPQTLLSFENKNPVFGVTVNPWNRNYTSGGSSGGEVCMVSSRASVIGIGTDVGGSLRIPAHFSGCYTIKPTSRRFSLKGFKPSMAGQEAVPVAGGPIANSVDDLILILRELFSKPCWDVDHELIPLSLDTTECNNMHDKLVVGYFLDDGVSAASPPCQRAVLHTINALRAAGHTVIEFQPPPIVEAIELYYTLMSADGNATLAKQLIGEKWEDYSTAMISAINQPRILKQTVAAISKYLLNDPVAGRLILATGKRSVEDLWKAQYRKKIYRQQFFDAWQQAGNRFDVLLCPAHALPAVPHNSFKNISFACSYTMLYNLLDLPAGVVPVTTVDKNVDAWNGKSKSVLEGRIRGQYNHEKMHGLPIGVQVVGLPMEDETVLRAMKQISQLIPWSTPPPTAPHPKEE